MLFSVIAFHHLPVIQDKLVSLYEIDVATAGGVSRFRAICEVYNLLNQCGMSPIQLRSPWKKGFNIKIIAEEDNISRHDLQTRAQTKFLVLPALDTLCR